MSRLMSSSILLGALVLNTTWLAQAQAADPHTGHTMPSSTTTAPVSKSDSPSTAAYEAANAKMHHDMAIAFTGNADRDFLAGMIPHHQGAIDMAQVVLQYGKDPKVRKLAQAIIRAQQREITQMQGWLKAMEHRDSLKTRP